MKQFEYKIIYTLSEELETTLNELGRDGWELVSVNNSGKIHSLSGICILKRILK
jgi:hypothetical protein